MINNSIAREALSHYLTGLTTEDTILLGCTHFPVFKQTLRQLIAPHIQLVDSAEATAKALKEHLLAAQLCRAQSSRGEVQYLVTDSVKRFQTVGEIFLEESLATHEIELVDASPR